MWVGFSFGAGGLLIRFGVVVFGLGLGLGLGLGRIAYLARSFIVLVEFNEEVFFFFASFELVERSVLYSGPRWATMASLCLCAPSLSSSIISDAGR